jgi:hypothetical protein
MNKCMEPLLHLLPHIFSFCAGRKTAHLINCFRPRIVIFILLISVSTKVRYNGLCTGLDRSLGLQDFGVIRISKQSAHEGGTADVIRKDQSNDIYIYIYIYICIYTSSGTWVFKIFITEKPANLHDCSVQAILMMIA